MNPNEDLHERITIAIHKGMTPFMAVTLALGSHNSPFVMDNFDAAKFPRWYMDSIPLHARFAWTWQDNGGRGYSEVQLNVAWRKHHERYRECVAVSASV